MNDQLLGTVDTETGTVHLTRELSAPRAEVWAALTDPSRLAAWLGPVRRGAPGPDATFVLGMDVEATATCTVLTWDPPNELHLTWDYTGEGPSLVEFSLSETTNGTRLTVRHERIPVDAVQYGAGWHLYLDALDVHLQGDVRFPGDDGTAFMAVFRELETAYREASRAMADPMA